MSLNSEEALKEAALDGHLERWEKMDAQEGHWEAEANPKFWCAVCSKFTGIPGVPCDCETARTSDPLIERFRT